MDRAKGRTPFLARVFLPFALAYILSYLYRVANTALAPELIRELELSAADLGLMTGIYFATFALFQLPLGLLLDRYGPSRVTAILLIFAGLGAFLFSLGQNLLTLILARALIGLGVSSCLMAAFQAYRQWLPADRLVLANSCQSAAGGIGFILGGGAIGWMALWIPWRLIFLLLSGLTLVMAASLWLRVPRHPPHQTPDTQKDSDLASPAPRGFFPSLRLFLRDPLVRRAAPLCIVFQAAFLSEYTLWVGPWLHDLGGLSPPQIALTLMVMALCFTFGHLTWGLCADRLAARVAPLHLCALCSVLALVCQGGLIFAPSSLGLTAILWCLSALFLTATIIPYAVLAQRFSKSLSGRLLTAINGSVFTLAFLFQWGIGRVIDLWSGTAQDFSPMGYRGAFLFIWIGQALALAHFFRWGRAGQRAHSPSQRRE